MSGTYCDEDAEVRVGVVVRPLRGHWKPAKGSTQIARSSDSGAQSDGSLWKTNASDYDKMANMQFTSKMVYSGDSLGSTDSRSLPSTSSRSQMSSTSSAPGDTSTEKTSKERALVPQCPSTCRCYITGSNIHNHSPPPELNRIKLPPDLERIEEKKIEKRNGSKNGADLAAKPKDEGQKEKLSLSTARGSSSPKELIQATSRPLPPPPKKYPDLTHVTSGDNLTPKRIALANIDIPTPPARRK
ncbi:hypothetical protein GCK32_010115, partial [Trichostrongylus colubriformis]